MLPLYAPTNGLTKLEAFTKFLTIAFKEGEHIWLKHANNKIYCGKVSHDGQFDLIATKGEGTTRSAIGCVGSAYSYLSDLAHAEDGGVFFIPGKPTDYPLNEYCIESDLLSAELDDGTALEQWEIIYDFYQISGLTPSLVLTSGGKSYHIHNKLAWKLPIAERNYLMRLFTIALGSDPAVCSPHQPMRAPGFFRKEKGKYQELIHADSSAVFSPAQWINGLRLVFAAKGLEFPESISDEQFSVYKRLRRDKTFNPKNWSNEVLHPPTPAYTFSRNTNQNHNYDGAIVPLETFLSMDDQKLVVNGIGEGGRNLAGFKLAVNLFATANRLDFLGIKYAGYPDDLFDQFCNRCSPPLSLREKNLILKSVGRERNATPTLPDEALLKRATWYEYSQKRSQGGYSFGSRSGVNPLSGEISKAEFEKRFGNLSATLDDEQLSERSAAERSETTSAESNKPKSPYEYWSYLKKNLSKMVRSTLEWHRSLDKKWGDLHDELPQNLGENDIVATHIINSESDNTIYYNQGERLEFWKDFISTGVKYVFDRSTMGLGKSYDAGLLEADSLGVDKLIYVAAEHRNITTPTLENWTDLVPRHNGLVRDELGKLRRRTAKSVALGEPWAVKPNCARTGLLALLRDRNIEAADAASTICQSCPHFEGCRSGSGDYTYLYDRGQVLQKSRFRCHPASLPPLDQFDYSPNPDKMRKHKKPRTDAFGNQVFESPVRGTGLIWEEWSQILTDSRTITANLGDIHQLMGYLMIVNPELANRLQLITSALASLMDVSGGKKQSKFGWNHFMIVKKLEGALGIPQSEFASLFSDLIIELDKWTNPQFTGAIDSLFQIGDEIDGVNVADLPRAVRDRLGKSEAELIAEATTSILKQWLPEFLGVISGMDAGLCNINFDEISITICDKRLIHIAKAAAFNIFLDATEMPENLAAILGVDVSSVVTVAQSVELSPNHTTVLITGLGRLGSGRGNEQTRRKDEVLKRLVVDHPDLAIVDWKKFINPEFGDELGCNQFAWWRDSRGTNDIYNNHQTAIALVGIPTKPVEQYRAMFACRYGYVPDAGEEEITRWVDTAAGWLPFTDSESSDPLFREFIYSDIQSTIEQGIGRLRASRRSDEQLTIYLLGDFAHRFPITITVAATDITRNAATKSQTLEMAIIKAIKTIQTEQHAHKNKPAHITLTAIAERVGKSLGYLSKFIKHNLGWKSSDTFLDTLQTLLFNTNSKCQYQIHPPIHTSNSLDHLTTDDKFLLEHYIPLSYEKLEGLETIIPQVLQDIFDHAAEYGKQCLDRILNALPNNVRQDILTYFLSLLSQEELEELIT